jgi:hypothetical protein
MQHRFKFPQIHDEEIFIAQFPGVDISSRRGKFTSSTVERVSKNKQLLIRTRLGDSLSEATRLAAEPEKADCFCEEQLGFGTAKAVIASRVVTVHASTSFAPSQELAARA